MQYLNEYVQVLVSPALETSLIPEVSSRGSCCYCQTWGQSCSFDFRGGSGVQVQMYIFFCLYDTVQCKKKITDKVLTDMAGNQ